MLNNLKTLLLKLRLIYKALFESISHLFHRNSILIYTMGKVGSTTVYNSIKNSNASYSVSHLHFLSDDLKQHKQFMTEVGMNILPAHMYLGEFISRVIPLKSSWKIISLVRDPIAFTISDIFQNPDFFHDVISENGEIDEEKVLNHLTVALKKKESLAYVYEWFDREIKSVFGIDIFNKEFDKSRGYQTYNNGNAELLVLRLEDLNSHGIHGLKSFLGIPDLTLTSQNIRTETQVAGKYKYVLKNLRIDREVCEQIYSSSFVKYFYSDEMIEHMISKWSKAGDKGNL
jgi:hypothetical protein